MKLKFVFLWDKAAEFEHSEMDLADVNETTCKLNQVLLDKRYVVSRMTIPEQKLEYGVLTLVVKTGRIHNFIYSKESHDMAWRTAFLCQPDEAGLWIGFLSMTSAFTIRCVSS